MKTIVQRIAFPAGRRVYVTSDIHGHCQWLREVLKKAAFGPDDILIIVGDLIDKGPDSLETVRYIMELAQSRRAYPLMGNVDAWRLQMMSRDTDEGLQTLLDYSRRAKKRWGGSLFGDMAEEMKRSLDSVEDTRAALRQARERFSRELAFLKGLPTMLETPDYLFVHGGVPTDRTEELEALDAFQFLKNDSFLEKEGSFSKWVVVGHWPVCLYGADRISFSPVVNSQRRIVAIDGGCGIKPLGGQLNLVELPASPDGDFTFYSHDAAVPALALDAQAEDIGCGLYIKYTDNRVETLRDMGDYRRVRHLSTGKVIDVPSVLFYQNAAGETVPDDIADYRLPVEAGDRVSVVLRTSRGSLVKKNGLMGWYFGRLA